MNRKGQQRMLEADDPRLMPVGKMIETLNPLFFKYGVTQQHLAAARRNDETADRINEWVADLYIEKGVHPFKSDKRLLSMIERSQYAGLRDWHSYMGLRVSESDVDLPLFMRDILFSRCPFSGKRKIDTHFLCCFPHDFNGRAISVDGAVDWRKRVEGKGGPSPIIIRPCHDSKEYKSALFEVGGWFLIYRGIIPESSNITREDQAKLMPEGYRFSTLLEVAFGLSFYSLKHQDLKLEEAFLGTKAGIVSGRVREPNLNVELKSFGVEYEDLPETEKSFAVGAFATMKL